MHACGRGNERKPRRISALRGVAVEQVSIGGWHCLALDAGGLVYAWGGNEYGQCHVDWDVRCASRTRVLTPCMHGSPCCLWAGAKAFLGDVLTSDMMTYSCPRGASLVGVMAVHLQRGARCLGVPDMQLLLHKACV